MNALYHIRHLCQIGFICTLAQTVLSKPFSPTSDKAGTVAMQEKIASYKDQLINATVAIQIKGTPGSGSGVIVSEDGLIMTAAHVVRQPGKKLFIIMADGSVKSATSLGLDHSTDAALAKMDAPGPYPWRPYAKETTYQTGDWTLALGHPGGPIIGRPAPVRLGRIIAAGTTSGFRKPLTTNATVISGDSGGPLFNLDGEVIGIHSNIAMPWHINNHVPIAAFLENWQDLVEGKVKEKDQHSNHSNQFDNFSFDAPLSSLRKEVRELLKKKATEGNPEAKTYMARPYLLHPHELQAIKDRWGEHDAENPSLQQESYLGLRLDLTRSQPTLAEITSDSPAEKGGLMVGDVITSINTVKPSHITEFINSIKSLPPEQTATIQVLRKGQPYSLTIKPARRYARRSFNNSITGQLHNMLRAPQIAPDTTLSGSRKDNTESFFSPFTKSTGDSVVKILHDDSFIAYGTVVSDNGEIITKASLLGTSPKSQTYTIEHDGQSHPLNWLAEDKKNDLALLKLTTNNRSSPDSINLKPVIWSKTIPDTGHLTVTSDHTGKFVAHGTVTQPIRPCPKAGGEISAVAESRAYLGVTLDQDFDTTLVTTVSPGSPAAIAGILEGDIIQFINGTKVNNLQELSDQVGTYEAGRKIKLAIKRGDKTIIVHPILGSAKSHGQEATRNSINRDKMLLNLSRMGGKISKRRVDFPACIYHDTLIKPNQCGSPIFNLDGEAIGVNIARNHRFRSLAIPAKNVRSTLKILREKAKVKAPDKSETSN